MKPFHNCLAIAGSLMIATATFAQETISIPVHPDNGPPAVAAPQPSPGANAQNQAIEQLNKSPLWQGYLSVIKDLSPIMTDDGDVKAQMERLEKFEFSAETKQKLFELFGNEKPLHLTRSNLPNGNIDYSLVLDGLDYQDREGGGKAHTSPLTAKMTYNPQYTRAHVTASMPEISFNDGKTIQITASDLSYIADQTKGFGLLWLGSATASMAGLAIDNSVGPVHIRIDGASLKTGIKARKKLMDFDFDYAIRTIFWGNDGLGPIHMSVGVAGLDGESLNDMIKKANALERGNLDQAQRLAATTNLFKDFSTAMLIRGVTIDVRDFSVQYHGRTAEMKGRIAIKNVQKSDFDTPKLIAEKVTARFDTQVPMAIMIDISQVVTRNALEAQNKNGPPVSDQDVVVNAKKSLDGVLTKLLQEKWIRIEHDNIRSTIEFKTGKLFVNGKRIDFPPPSRAPVNSATPATPAPVTQ